VLYASNTDTEKGGSDDMEHTLAVELPADCPLKCAFCRTEEHSGNPQAVLDTLRTHVGQNGYSEIYLTSTGETGLSPIFKEVVGMANSAGMGVAVLCATAGSVIPGLTRVEVSLNPYTSVLAKEAIAKAKELGIPVVISMIDEGIEEIDLETIAAQYGADGVIVRALQPEGASDRGAGTTRIYQRPRSSLGNFPATAYAELEAFRPSSPLITCIGPNGTFVPFLGGYVGAN